MASGWGLSVGSRVIAAGRGVGILVVDNDDGTWNVEFEAGGEADMPARSLVLADEQPDWAAVAATAAEASGPSGLRLRAAHEHVKGEDRADDSSDEAAQELDDELRRTAPKAAARQAWLSCFFLLLMVIPGASSVFFFLYGFLQEKLWPLTPLVPLGDAAMVERIFAGHQPWLVSCVTAKSARKEASDVLKKAAELLGKRGVRTARMYCWEPMKTAGGSQTLATRFSFDDKPPVVLVSRGSGSPKVIRVQGLSAKKVAKQAWAALSSPTRASKRSKAGNSAKRDVVGRRPAAMEADEDLATSQNDNAGAGVSDAEEEVDLDA